MKKNLVLVELFRFDYTKDRLLVLLTHTPPVQKSNMKRITEPRLN